MDENNTTEIRNFNLGEKYFSKRMGSILTKRKMKKDGDREREKEENE